MSDSLFLLGDNKTVSFVPVLKVEDTDLVYFYANK